MTCGRGFERDIGGEKRKMWLASSQVYLPAPASLLPSGSPTPPPLPPPPPHLRAPTAPDSERRHGGASGVPPFLSAGLPACLSACLSACLPVFCPPVHPPSVPSAHPSPPHPSPPLYPRLPHAPTPPSSSAGTVLHLHHRKKAAVCTVPACMSLSAPWPRSSTSLSLLFHLAVLFLLLCSGPPSYLSCAVGPSLSCHPPEDPVWVWLCFLHAL